VDVNSLPRKTRAQLLNNNTERLKVQSIWQPCTDITYPGCRQVSVTSTSADKLCAFAQLTPKGAAEMPHRCNTSHDFLLHRPSLSCWSINTMEYISSPCTCCTKPYDTFFCFDRATSSRSLSNQVLESIKPICTLHSNICAATSVGMVPVP
jgi:hypothetical protein